MSAANNCRFYSCIVCSVQHCFLFLCYHLFLSFSSKLNFNSLCTLALTHSLKVNRGFFHYKWINNIKRLLINTCMKTWSELFCCRCAASGTEGHWSCSPDMWQSCHLVQQPQESGRHLSKGSMGAHGNNQGVMSALGRACVHEWLRQDTGPLNMTYTLSFIIVFSVGLSVTDDFDARLFWQLSDYSRGNLDPLHKNCDYFWLVCQKILLSKAQSRQWDGCCGSAIFSKGCHVRKASVSLIP